jgi:hypothetical protein
MTAYYVGSLNLGAAIPVALQAQVGLDAAVAVSLPDISAKLAGWIALQAQLILTPPSLGGQITAVGDLLLQLEASVSLGLPDVDFQLAAAAGIIAELEATLGALQAQVAFSASLSALFGVGGIHAYHVESTAGQVGADLQAVLSAGIPGADSGVEAYGVLLVATTSAGRAALQATLG